MQAPSVAAILSVNLRLTKNTIHTGLIHPLVHCLDIQSLVFKCFVAIHLALEIEIRDHAVCTLVG